MKYITRFLVAALFAVGVALPALAQSQTDGAISGLVKDPNGAIVPGASVTARNEQTSKEATATSDDEGRQQSVVVEVGRINPLDVNLGVAGTTETVEVTAEAPVINTEQQDFSTN